jgi:hypothetical protein
MQFIYSLINSCFVSILLSNALNLLSSFTVRYQIAQPYKTGRITVLCTLIGYDITAKYSSGSVCIVSDDGGLQVLTAVTMMSTIF